jgi:hypothetical protein
MNNNNLKVKQYEKENFSNVDGLAAASHERGSG